MKHLTLKLHEPSDEDLAEIAMRAKRSFMFQAEAAFHKEWAAAAAWIKTGTSGRRELVVTVHVADIDFENTEAATKP